MASVLPMVPGVNRETDGYLKRVMARSGRPGTAPNAAAKPRLLEQHAPVMPQVASMRPGTSAGGPRTLSKGSSKVPEFIMQEKQVLRFYSYFQESIAQDGGSVTSKGSAGFRVRKFSIMFYLSDGTMSIEEPRQLNSGMSQGMFMKRTVVNKPASKGGSPYTPADLAVGETVSIFGREFHIVDADAQTRSWYDSKLGITLVPAVETPDDGHAAERARFERPPAKALAPGREKGEYYKKDRRVLRFFCKYDDYRLQGDRRDYILYYYLLNDTVEIKEIAAEGRHNFPNLLRRQKLPKDSLHVPTGYGGVISPRDPQRDRIASVTWKDLRCGSTVNVYGRHLLLMSCDDFTSQWYESKDMHQKTLTVGHDEVERLNNVVVPPYNGFGNEGDLFAMGLSLEPMNKEVDQEEYERFLKGDKKVCRFQAKLVNVQGPDKTREFVVNYFLANDTLSIFEPQVRNSGVVGGLFLARGRYKKYIPAVGQEAEGTRLSEKLTMDGGLMEARVGLGGQLSRWLRPTDFVPGSIITFEMPQSGSKICTLQIVDHDEYTRKLLLDKEIFPQTPSQLALIRISEACCSAHLDVRSLLQSHDSEGLGSMSVTEFENALDEIEEKAAQAPCARAGIVKLSSEERRSIAELFADAGRTMPFEQKPNVLWEDFADLLVVASPQVIKLKDRTGGLRVEERILKSMNTDFDETEGGGKLRAIFREFDPIRSGFVSKSHWVVVLKKTSLNAIMTRQVAEALCLEHDTLANGSLDYNSLCDHLFAWGFESQASAVEQTDDILAPVASTQEAGGVPQLKLSKRFEPPPTVNSYLKRVNERLVTENGDMNKQLLRAMRSFCSAFARAQRKKMIRKHFLAFDVTNTGKISKHQFLETVNEVAAEFFIDFDNRDRNLLAEFFFPRELVRIDYEMLLDIITNRHVPMAHQFRNAIAEQGADYEEAFTMTDNAARIRDFGGTLNLFETRN